MTDQSEAFSDLIRIASGRQPAAPAGPVPDGNIGIGLGSAAVPRQREPIGMSARIRAARAARGFTIESFAEGYGE